MSVRPRVLVLSRSYPSDLLSTLGIWVERPTRLLAKRCEMTVISPVPWCPPLPAVPPLAQYVRFRSIPRRETRQGVDVLRPRFLVGPGTLLYPLEAHAYELAVRRVVHALHRARPFDLVHAHFIYPDGVVAHRLARRLGIPFVVTEHAPWTGWLDRLGVARQALPAAAAAALLLPVSGFVAATIRSYLGDRVRTEVLPVGVDEALFRPAAADRRRREQILFVGLINYTKGVDVLLHAVRLLVRERPNVRLLLAGGAHYRDTLLQERALRNLSTSLGLDGCVSFLGKIPPADAARLMGESAVVVLPSRAESFGAVLVEALACGTPVVSTRSGGPEDVLTDSVGVLVEPDDPAALAAALADVLEHPECYPAEDLREHAVRRFGLHALAGRLEAVYRDVSGR